MRRRTFLKAAAAMTALPGSCVSSRADDFPATQVSKGGITLDGFHFKSIVPLKDGTLVTSDGQQSADGGRSWRKSKTFRPTGNKGLLRLPNGELGTYSGSWSLNEALGTAPPNPPWVFRWSADEGKNWSEPVTISVPGLTMGLENTMIALKSGRLVLATYSQFLGSRFDKRGASSGIYRGVRLATETEGHFPEVEAGKVYYSDDNGRQWKLSDGWVIGWRDQKWSDYLSEPCPVELKDGRVLLLGRTLTGRISQATSDDGGHSWWPGAKPAALASSGSPCCVARLPKTGDLLVVWNQHSRAEIRKGLRRSRLSSAISKDDGKTWQHFKNIEAIKSLADVSHLPPDDDLSPVIGDPDVGELPDDFEIFHYPNLSVIGDQVFVCYQTMRYQLNNAIDDKKSAVDAEGIVTSAKRSGMSGKKSITPLAGARTRILSIDWFYD